MITSPHQPRTSNMLLGIAFILTWLFLVSLISQFFFLHWLGLEKLTPRIFFISRMFYWIGLILLWLYSTKIEKQKLLIWEEKKYKLFYYILSIVILMLIIYGGSFTIQRILSLAKLETRSSALDELIGILKTNKFLLVFTAITAGFIEELIVRGYLQTRLTIIFKSPLLAIIISSLLFGILHYKYGTLHNVIIPVFIGLIFAYHYWKYRNIKILIICHCLVDLASLFTLVNQK